jgi:pimeloyl-ACP methyl ester carboxylesterase
MIDGVEVYYQDQGTGPAILMAHGSNSTLRGYDRVADILVKRHYRVIRYDMPAQGLSGPIPDAVAASDVKAEDIAEALLTNLGVKKVTALGMSSGSTLAWFLAAKRPDMVERLILSSGPADVVDTTHIKFSKRLLEAQSALGHRYLSNGPADNAYNSRAYWDAFFDFFTGEPERVGPAEREEYYDINRRFPEPHKLRLTGMVVNHAATMANADKVACPVLLLWGERDPQLTPPTLETLASYLKNADVSKVFMPDVGHYPALEVPERYAQIVAAYIEAVTPVKPVAPPPADR